MSVVKDPASAEVLWRAQQARCINQDSLALESPGKSPKTGLPAPHGTQAQVTAIGDVENQRGSAHSTASPDGVPSGSAVGGWKHVVLCRDCGLDDSQAKATQASGRALTSSLSFDMSTQVPWWYQVSSLSVWAG